MGNKWIGASGIQFPLQGDPAFEAVYSMAIKASNKASNSSRQSPQRFK